MRVDVPARKAHVGDGCENFKKYKSQQDRQQHILIPYTPVSNVQQDFIVILILKLVLYFFPLFFWYYSPLRIRIGRFLGRFEVKKQKKMVIPAKKNEPKKDGKVYIK